MKWNTRSSIGTPWATFGIFGLLSFAVMLFKHGQNSGWSEGTYQAE